jgi:hypothetical protein
MLERTVPYRITTGALTGKRHSRARRTGARNRTLVLTTAVAGALAGLSVSHSAQAITHWNLGLHQPELEHDVSGKCSPHELR